MIKISLIIPVYNVKPYINECFNSIVVQNFDDLEVICVDDGSTDGSFEILKEYASKDRRFIIIQQENQGQGIARNNAIKIANGEYIMFIDPDDWFEKNAFENLYKFAKLKEANVVQFNYKEYNEHTKKYKNIDFRHELKKRYRKNFSNLEFYTWKDFKDGCLYNLEMHAWTRIYKTEFIRANNIQFAPTKKGEDQLFVNGVTLLTDKTYFYPEYFYNYRYRCNSAVNTKSKHNLEIFKNLDLMGQFLKENNLDIELEEEFIKYKQKVLEWQYCQTLEKDINSYLEKSKLYLPINSYNNMLKRINNRRNFIENIFSLKNEKENGVKHKRLTILGISFRIS